MNAFPKYIIEEVIKPLDLGLETLLQTPMGSLSGGQRQIISLIMATIIKPRILLLDEPTAALDPLSATKMLLFAQRYIKEHKLTTLMITHDPMLARILGNRLWVIEQGKVAKEYVAEEKMHLDPHDMSGDIDYQKIQTAG
jgi:putative ABC transport system ATP-binding protein